MKPQESGSVVFDASKAAILPKPKEIAAFWTMPWRDALADKRPTTDGGGSDPGGRGFTKECPLSGDDRVPDLQSRQVRIAICGA